MVRRGGGFRIAAAFALAAVLMAATPLAAAGPGGSGRAAPGRPALEALWTWARAWLGLPFGETAPAGAADLRKAACGAGADAGAHIDPNGCPAQGSSDAGASIDPDG